MRHKFEYKSEDEKERILVENSNLYLIEVQNITEGNFLIFSESPPEVKTVYMNIPQGEIESIKERQEATDAAVLQLLMEGMV